jgi:hypothetical protein
MLLAWVGEGVKLRDDFGVDMLFLSSFIVAVNSGAIYVIHSSLSHRSFVFDLDV